MSSFSRACVAVMAMAAVGCGDASLTHGGALDAEGFVAGALTTGGPACSCSSANPNVLFCPSTRQPSLYEQVSCGTGGCQALPTGGACCQGSCDAAPAEEGRAGCMCGMSNGQPALGCFRAGEAAPYEVTLCACRSGAVGAYCDVTSGGAPAESPRVEQPPPTQAPPPQTSAPSEAASCPSSEPRDLATNDTPAGAYALGDIYDTHGMELGGSIGGGDASDWYRFEHIDVPLGEGRSYRVVSANTSLRVCAYALCRNGAGISETMLSCGRGRGEEAYRSFDGVTYQGCCGPAGVDRYDEAFRMHVACDVGLFSDDSATVFVQVSANVPACVDYRLYL